MVLIGLFSSLLLWSGCIVIIIFCQSVMIVHATMPPRLEEAMHVTRSNIRSSLSRVTLASSLSLFTQEEEEEEDPMAVSLNPRHLYWLLQKYGADSLNSLLLSWNAPVKNNNTNFNNNDELSQLRWDPQEQPTSTIVATAILNQSLMSSFASATATEQLNSLEREEFLQECRAYILSDQVLADGLISQVDTTNFLVDFCIEAQVCEPGYETSFEALDFRLQLSFTRFICPFRNDGVQDVACLDELDAQGNDEFGYIVTTSSSSVVAGGDMVVLQERLGGYCAWLWYFGSDFHGVSFDEDTGGDGGATTPSVAPSGMPTHGTVLPTQSSVPTQTMAPSQSPTLAVEFPIDFTFIVGFDNENITARTLDDGNKDVVIMDDVRLTIRKVLAWNDITRRKLEEERWIGFRDGRNGSNEPEFSQIHHKHVADENACPESFLESISCVRVVTQVIVYANPDYHDDESVNVRVQSSIQNSMIGNLFLDSMERTEIKEVLYVSAGSVLEDGTDNELANNRSVLTEGGVAGIAVGALFLAAIIGLFLFSRSRSEDDRSINSRDGPSSDDSYGLQADEDAEIGISTAVKGHGEDRSLEIMHKDNVDTVNGDKVEGISRATQLDTVTGAVIPAAANSRSSASASASIMSSRYSDSEKEDGIWIGRLDAAVSAGDWAAVAAIAGDVSTADEPSTISSINTHKLDISSDRESMSDADTTRRGKIGKLIVEGDWNAAGATAAALEDAYSSSGSEMSNDVKNIKVNVDGDMKKRSILDFIAGPWQSSAVSKAIAQDAPESNVEDVNISARKYNMC